MLKKLQFRKQLRLNKREWVNICNRKFFQSLLKSTSQSKKGKAQTKDKILTIPRSSFFTKISFPDAKAILKLQHTDFSTLLRKLGLVQTCTTRLTWNETNKEETFLECIDSIDPSSKLVRSLVLILECKKNIRRIKKVLAKKINRKKNFIMTSHLLAILKSKKSSRMKTKFLTS